MLDIKLPLAIKDFGHYGLRTDLWQIRLLKVMFIHEEAKHFNTEAFCYLMVLLFIGMYHSAERVQKPIQRVLFVGSNFVNDAVKSFNR
jgi:hypothetical protein